MNLEQVCPLTTADALRRAVSIAPDLEAVVTAAERVTFQELADRVALTRGALRAAGIGRGSRVAICLGNGPRWVELFLAISSLGAITVPVNTRFRAAEIGYVLRQSGVSMLVLQDRLLNVDFVDLLRSTAPAIDRALPDPELPQLRDVVVIGTDVPAGARSWEQFHAAASAPGEPECEPDDLVLVQYTSGTTAFPKGVLLTHRNMTANGFFSGARVGLRVGDRLHSARPFFHVAGSTLSVLSCLQHVTTLVTMERFVAGEALDLMQRERCSHFSGNDTIALMLLNHPDRSRYRLSLRGAWLAATPAVVRRVITELGAREAVVGYGLSEASPNVAQSAWWEDEDVRVSGRMLPQPGVEVEIRDPATGAVGPPGQVGSILVRGWNVMQGYLDPPEVGGNRLTGDGWLSTGDLGRIDDTGRLQFVGRTSELIRVGGENVSPSEVEDLLHGHPAVQQAAVVGLSHPRLVEVPVAFVVLRAGRSAEPEQIIAWARERIAGFKVPQYVYVVEDFDRIGMTASGKVQRRKLVAHAERLFGSSATW